MYQNITVDPEDLELLDVLETLADTRAVTVDNDSELGSQASRRKSVPFSTPHEEHGSDGEENWHDESVVAEEVLPLIPVLPCSIFILSLQEVIMVLPFRMKS